MKIFLIILTLKRECSRRFYHNTIAEYNDTHSVKSILPIITEAVVSIALSNVKLFLRIHFYSCSAQTLGFFNIQKITNILYIKFIYFI